MAQRLTQTTAPQELPLPKFTNGQTRSYVLVADGAFARLFNSTHKQWQEVKDFSHAASRKQGRELLTDRPGQFLNSAVGSRYGAEESTPVHEQELDKFVSELATELSRYQDSLDTLHLMVSPELLGKLRQKLSPALSKKLGRQIAKDVTTETPGQLQKRLEQALA